MNCGAVVLKFWLPIDKDEQERRLGRPYGESGETVENHRRSWRDKKWDLYEQAVDDMLVHTSTTYAPWIIVEGNNKYYAVQGSSVRGW